MASKTINTILNLQDRMSPKLLKVSSRVKSLDKDTQRATQRMANMANKWSEGVNKMTAKAVQLAKAGAAITAAASAAAGAYVIKGSDQYSGIQARLKLINDGQQTVAEFNKKIFKSANDARVPYQDIASTVGKLGILAGSAFKNNDEILRFSELMAKNFKVAGASTEEQSAGMYQLTQAMASGKLQGDEFRSILENAPLLAQAIAKEMKMPMGKLKEASKDGIITADVIKAALFNSANEIDERYKQIPKTFSDIAVQLKNNLTNKLQPTFQKLSDWLNSKAGETWINRINDGIDKVINHLPGVYKAIVKIYKFAEKLLKFLWKYQDVIIFFGTFIATFAGITKAVKLAKGAFVALKIAGLLASDALALTPFGWITLAIAAVVAAIVLLKKNWSTVKGWFKLSPEGQAAIDAIKSGFGFIADNVKKFIKSLDNIPDFALILAGPIGWVLALVKHFDDLRAAIKKAFKWLQEFNKEGNTDKLITNTKLPGGGTQKGPVTRHALGTHYWRGGPTSINERGGEIVDLPNGSRVIPADKSAKILSSSNSQNNVVININGVGKSTREIMDELVPQLKLAIANM